MTTSSYVSPMTSVKNASNALNINNMKGIEFRKTTKSKTMNACELV
jgi:hypothetical protein